MLYNAQHDTDAVLVITKKNYQSPAIKVDTLEGKGRRGGNTDNTTGNEASVS